MTPAAFGCRGNTIRLRSGRYFDLSDPKPDQFTLADIAGALSNVCRFGGHVPRFYSVAEHCIHCERQARADGRMLMTRRLALLHDAAEAFTGDIVKPLKIMLPEFAAIERRIEAVVEAKYGPFAAFDHAAVKEIDRAMLIAEKRAMFGPRPGETWTGESEVRQLAPLRTIDLPPVIIERHFLDLAIICGLDPTH